MQTTGYQLAKLHHKMKRGEKERNMPLSLWTSDLYTIEYVACSSEGSRALK